jgi:hypothetical protein
MHDYIVFARLYAGMSAQSVCRGTSMEPVYADKERITIYPFTEDRPEPVIGDVVHFWDGRGFNRHQVADIFTSLDETVWYRLVTGDGWHDQFVSRENIWGYVVPKKMLDAGIEPKDIYDGPRGE